MNESTKKSLKKYSDKCTRVQILLNPGNADDARIIAYLNEIDDGRPAATQMKALLLKHINMTTALKGIGNF